MFPWVNKVGYYLHFYPGLKKLLYEFRPDVIDLWEEPWGLVSVHAASLRNRHFPDTKILMETEQNLKKRIPSPFKEFWGYSVRQADYLVGRSEEAVSVSRLHGYQGRSAVIANGVDTALFCRKNKMISRVRFGMSDRQFIVGYAGRFVPEKGLLDMLEAIARVPNAHGWLVGGGPQKAALLVRASQSDLVGRIHFLDNQSPAALCEVMNTFDVLILPSRTAKHWKEQFGRVLAEAGACEVAVIGSDSGAIPDVVGNGGLVFPEGNVEELARCIQLLAADPDLTERLGKAGREQALVKYAWETVAAQYLNIITEMVQNAPEARTITTI